MDKILISRVQEIRFSQVEYLDMFKVGYISDCFRFNTTRFIVFLF